MYEIARAISLAVRVLICYFTIETTPVFADEAIQWLLGQMASVYLLLRLVSYTIVGRVIGYEKGEAPVPGVILYAMAYIPLSLVLWGVLWLLTWVGILPI